MRFLLISFFLLSFITSKGSDTLHIYTVSQLEDSMKVNPKPIVVYYYTDWCKYCKVMEKRTFAETEVIDSLNQNFYFVKFNGEYEEEITFLGRKYTYIKTGDKQGYHEFAYAFTKIQGYPTCVFLNKHFEPVDIGFGYLNKKQFLELLTP